MLPNAGVSTTPSLLRLDIRRFPWIGRLAADYAFDAARLSPFFAGDIRDAAAWRATIDKVQAYPRRRDDVVTVLAAQQARRGAPAAARDAVTRLRDPRTVAVVTGQQAGLFGGPLYTILKALSALRLAEEVRTTYGVPAVALFWVDAEDHDWAEVNACGVLDADTTLRTVALDAAAAPPPGRPIAHVQLGSFIEGALSALEASLAPSEFTPQVVDALRQAYAPDHGMADAFGRWLEALLGPRGLIVHDASDPAAKPLVKELFAREIARAGHTTQCAIDAGQALTALGYHAQVTPQPGSAAVFSTRDGRLPIRVADSGLTIGDQLETREALTARALEHPSEFSPNVLLRPLVQDTLFPTVCYVAGPSELAYLAQLKQVYEAFGVPMPLVHPRASATLVDANAGRFLVRGDVAFESLRAHDESALNALLAAALPPSIDVAVEGVLHAVEERMQTLAGEVAAVDATLEGAVRSAMGRMQDDVKKLQAKILQAAKRKDDTLRRQFKHAQAQAFPGGTPQERAVGAISFLNKYGPGLVDRLADGLTLEPGIHTVLTP